MKPRALLLALALVSTAAGAVLPDERLADPALEARARQISKELRCVVCQNQSIDDSDATLAHDLRLLVRERLVAGDSDAEVKDYLVDRYGSFVLLRPPLGAETLALWFGPLAVVLLGAAGLLVYLRRRPPGGGEAPLSAEEQARVERLIARKDDQ